MALEFDKIENVNRGNIIKLFVRETIIFSMYSQLSLENPELFSSSIFKSIISLSLTYFIEYLDNIPNSKVQYNKTYLY